MERRIVRSIAYAVAAIALVLVVLLRPLLVLIPLLVIAVILLARLRSRAHVPNLPVRSVPRATPDSSGELADSLRDEAVKRKESSSAPERSEVD